MQPVSIQPLGPGDIPSAVALLLHLNPETPSSVIEERLRHILTEHPHYHLFGAFSGDTLTGVAGGWIATKIWCGLYLEIDNLVVHPEHRSAGIGGALIRHLEHFAREKDCRIMSIDSYTSNYASHRLYHRLGFEIWSFHFIKPIA